MIRVCPKKISIFILILSIPILLGATSLFNTKKAPNFNIIGIDDPLLKNVQERLKELSETKPIQNQSDEELREQILESLKPYGYFKASIYLQRNPFLVKIDPGPQMRIGQVFVDIVGEGASNPEIKEVMQHLPLKAGDPLDSSLYEDLKQNFLTATEHQGFLRAHFSTSELLIDLDNYVAKINLVFDTGHQYYFGKVEFDPTYISPKLLYRYLPFQYGQPYSTDDILKLNSQLSGSGYFKSVTITPNTNTDERYIPIRVHLSRASRMNYSFGLGYGTDTGVRGRAGFSVVPVNRLGHKFNLIALGSSAQSALLAQYLIPGRNPMVNNYFITGNLSNLSYDAGHSNLAQLSIGQQHNLPTFQRNLSINGLYEGYRYHLLPREYKFTFYPRGSFTWLNTKDKLFSPTGYNLNLRILGASKALLSEENFIQGIINLKAALNVEPIRTRFYFHTIQGLTQINQINNLPLSLAPLLGGAENLKAYNFNSIGPGKVLTYVGFEIQKETKDKWYLVGFFDSGDVYQPSSRSLQKDVGAALMWVSPVGPIKIGLAQAVDNHFRRAHKSPKLVINMGPDL